MLQVNYIKLEESAITPSYSREGDAGLDFTATSKTYDNAGNVVYGTGIAIEIPKGYLGFLMPRGSVSNKLQMLANSVGLIDSNYRGEILFKFKPTVKGHCRVNSLFEDQYEVGDRVGQLVILPYPLIELNLTDSLSKTNRGEEGFGSSGK